MFERSIPLNSNCWVKRAPGVVAFLSCLVASPRQLIAKCWAQGVLRTSVALMQNSFKELTAQPCTCLSTLQALTLGQCIVHLLDSLATNSV